MVRPTDQRDESTKDPMPDEFEFAGRVTRILIAVHAARNGREVSAFGGSPYDSFSGPVSELLIWLQVRRQKIEGAPGTRFR